MKLFRRKKNAYFRKIDKNNRLIIVVKDATREELVYISNFLQHSKDFDYLVCDDRYKFIEVPRDVEIDVINKTNIKSDSQLKDIITKVKR